MLDPRVVRVQQLVDLERHREARELGRQLMTELPDDLPLLGAIAGVHLRLRAHRSALEVADQMVSSAPTDDWGHRLRALALAELGRPVEATSAASHARLLAPLAWETHAQYAIVAPAGLSRWPDPREAAARAVDLAPEEPETHFAAGLVAQRQGRNRAARAAYRRVLALAPEHASARNNLAVLLPGPGLGKSADDLVEALRLAPQDEVIRQNIDWMIGRLMVRLGLAAVTALVFAVVLAHGEPRPPQRTPETVLVAVALLGGGTTYVARLGRRLPRGVRQVALRRLVRGLPLRRLSISVVVVTIMTVLVALLPVVAEIGPLLVGVVGLVTLGAISGQLLRLLLRILRRLLLPVARRFVPSRT